jgi:hypothetical protein
MEGKVMELFDADNPERKIILFYGEVVLIGYFETINQEQLRYDFFRNLGALNHR